MKTKGKSAKISKINKPHRKFYVNDKLEFSFYYDETIKDKDQILKEFFNCRDWKFMKTYCNWEVKDTKINSDLSVIYINVKVGTDDERR